MRYIRISALCTKGYTFMNILLSIYLQYNCPGVQKPDVVTFSRT